MQWEEGVVGFCFVFSNNAVRLKTTFLDYKNGAIIWFYYLNYFSFLSLLIKVMC